MSESKTHEAVDVHVARVTEAHYHRQDTGGFVAVTSEGRAEARHYDTFGQSKAMLECRGRATLYLSVANAVHFSDQLTTALLEAGAIAPEPETETVG